MAKVYGKPVRLNEVKSWAKNSHLALARAKEIVGRAVSAKRFTIQQKRELKSLIVRSQNLHVKAAAAYGRLIDQHEELVSLAKGKRKTNPLTMLQAIIKNHQELGRHLQATTFESKTVLSHLQMGNRHQWKIPAKQAA